MSPESDPIKKAKQYFIEKISAFKKDILSKLHYNEITGTYENQAINVDKSKPTLVIITAGSGSGKDSVLDKVCEILGRKRVLTSTSRPRRANENEPDDAYEWLDTKEYGITEDNLKLTGLNKVMFLNRLKKRYGFIEVDIHNWKLYGTRKENLDKALEKNPAFMRVDINGLKTFQNLHKQGALGNINLVTVCLVPDNLLYTAEIIAKRGDVEKRLEEAVDTLSEAKALVNYFCVNKFNKDSDKGASYTAAGVIGLLRTIGVKFN